MKRITDTYVEFANKLDSTGEDSTAAVERLQNPKTIYRLFVALKMASLIGNELDGLKKHIYYGKDLAVGGLYQFMGQALNIPDVEPPVAVKQRITEHESIRFLHALMGVLGEVGDELGIVYLNYIIDGKPIDLVNVTEEVGDSLWYHALFAKFLGEQDFEDILIKNYNKLTARYGGTTWNADGALNRDLDRERRILELKDKGVLSKESAEEQLNETQFDPNHKWSYGTLTQIVNELRRREYRDIIDLKDSAAFKDLEQMALGQEKEFTETLSIDLFEDTYGIDDIDEEDDIPATPVG